MSWHSNDRQSRSSPRRWWQRRARKLLIVVAAVTAFGAPVAAQDAPVPDTELSSYAAISAQVEATQAELAQAALDAELAQSFLDGATATAERADDALEALTGSRRAGAHRLARARGRLSDVAAAAYVTGGTNDLGLVLDSSDPTDMARRQTIVEAVGVRSQDAVADYQRAADAVSAEVRDAEADQRLAMTALASATVDADAAHARVEQLAARLAGLLDELGRLGDTLLSAPSGLLSVVVPDSDLPLVALDAYRRAATYANSQYQGCHMGWWSVAGIAKVESNHGRYGGAHPAVDGDVVPHIRGIPLNGTRNTRAITDTDGGALDDDTVWDRAIGPMQFIPSTWVGYDRMFDLDARGTGHPSPDNIYDAARATGLYLCRSGGDMSTSEGMRRAFFAYNHSTAYVDKVLGYALSYAGLAAPVLAQPVVVPPTPPPTTSTTTPASPTTTTVPTGFTSPATPPRATATPSEQDADDAASRDADAGQTPTSQGTQAR